METDTFGNAFLEHAFQRKVPPKLLLRQESVPGDVKNQEQISLVSIDVETGEVFEVHGTLSSVTRKKRGPLPNEMRVASQLLNKGMYETVPAAEYERLRSELETMTRRNAAAEARALKHATRVDDLVSTVKQLAANHWSDEDRNLLADALDMYAEFTRDTGQYEVYERVKKFFKRLTGRKWVDDGSEDDEQEDD